MHSISLNGIGKKYRKEWIFRNLDYEVKSGARLAITGANGSGKSTLLAILSGYVSPSEGKIHYRSGNTENVPEKLWKIVSLAAPYLQLIENFTLSELIFHSSSFKPLLAKMGVEEFCQVTGLMEHKNKMIGQFSSGMKQRLKLGLALLADTEIVLLDEPLSNLDHNGYDWYKKMIRDYAGDRTIIVCSNTVGEEYYFCRTELQISAYKR